jgi:RimJ/RimL family protein N-acetyltransferase
MIFNNILILTKLTFFTMRTNATIVLTSSDSKTILVPYRKEHVIRYHEWMQDVELQELTASEPLSLEEEYEMQQSWFEDEKKCTFIIISPLQISNEGMVGDVNLYFNDFEDSSLAEIEIMIAEKDMRKRGIGRTAALMMMNYGATHLGITRFIAKISFSNIPSIRLFHSFGFLEVSKSEFFKELTLERIVDHSFTKLCETITYRISNKQE